MSFFSKLKNFLSGKDKKDKDTRHPTVFTDRTRENQARLSGRPDNGNQENRLLSTDTSSQYNVNIVGKSEGAGNGDTFSYRFDAGHASSQNRPQKDTYTSSQNNVNILERPESSGNRGRDTLRDGLDAANASSQNRPKKIVIGYHKLKTWANETDAGQLLLWIANESDALTDLLKGDIKPDWYSLLIKICTIILSANHQRQALTKVLNVIITSHFLDQGLYFFTSIKRQSYWPEAETFYETVLAIIKQIITLLPEHASKCRMSLSIICGTIFDSVEEGYEDKILAVIRDLQEKLKKLEQENRDRKNSRKIVLPFTDTDTPEDFRTLSVIPELSDLRPDAEPFVRAVLAKGAYRGEDHYLDVQFRLMREDFIQPLRNGINEFRINGCKKNYRSSDIRLYFDVHILGMTTVNGINHVLQFDVTSLKSVKWEHSKRFLYGSLLCLSKDNFETVLFATVAFRDPKNLKSGIINVEFKSGLETVLCSTSLETFVLAESTAYFEAYCPILEGLKETNSNMSLQKYFIYCQEKLQPPKYLLGGVHKYDLSNLMKSGKTTLVPVLNTMSWPPAESLRLNESQTEAVKLALTKELAIIQGPPGTGKTYVGLKVMRVLMDNQDQIAGSERSSHDPILVVCYTNHALDQFLEGVVEFCPEGVVRVGGKSSSKVLETLNLRHLKQNEVLSKSVKKAFWDIKVSLNIISNNIENHREKMDSTLIGVLRENTLKRYMAPAHYRSLMALTNQGLSKKSGFQTKYWLNSSKTLDTHSLPQLIRQRLTNLILQMPEKSHMKANISLSRLKRKLQEMSVIERAQLYQEWLHSFQSELDLSVYENVILLTKSRCQILPDFEINHVIQEKIFNSIYSLSHTESDSTIECWMLGLDNSLSDQLDDIERLSNYFSQGEHDNDNDFDDVDGALDDQISRLIDTNMKEEEEIAKETKKVKETGALLLLLKAEKLGIGNDVEENGSVDDSEWELVSHKKSLSFTKLRSYLANIQPMTEEEEDNVGNLWTLDLTKRFALYNLWIQRYRSDLAEEMEELVLKYKQTMEAKRELRMENDLTILKQARVIGMTTTGAAKYRALLQAVACRIIVVEEAAEVLEAHIITALNENCKHLILIGDHQQLKPNPTVYTLAKDYNLDLSLFERLINNGIQHVTLKEQHRMRQSISKIMRHIYPDLRDHISVTKYENIRGVEKNIFFINHVKHESTVSDSKSKSNAYEASFLVALLKHFLLQGYEPSQITILATYAGQILTLKKELKAKNVSESVHVTTVDSYQGEENDIILLSLVRSNDESSVGFLKIDNRVCVALSRAKKGLFAIGNFRMLSSQSELWKKIVKTAEEDDIYGFALPVVCPNHASFKLGICFPEDFQKKFPDGGCGRRCKVRLKCGHTCPLKCHGYDSKHEKVKCDKRCAKQCPQGHPCKKWCHQECEDCTEKVEKTIPHCGHTDVMPCHNPAENAVCFKTCGVLLKCQHQCTGKCGDCHENNLHTTCHMPAEYQWPCDHISKVPCYMKPSVYPCPRKCQATLECGHKCTGTCSECVEEVSHVACKKKCSNILPCGHQCPSNCGIPCPPCIMTCSNSCQHSKCDPTDHTCGDKCIPCQEPCLIGCIHRKCGQKCHEECDIEICQERCLETNKCMHKCSGLCGELCVCAWCDTISSIPQTAARYRKAWSLDNSVDVEEAPLLIKIPSCGHIFHVDKLDLHLMQLYTNDQQYNLFCPVCKKAIQNCSRYNNIIKMKYLKREQAKEEIRQSNKITHHQVLHLEASKKILLSTDLDSTWSVITKNNINHLSTSHEVVSLSYTYKYAYILNELKLLQGSSHDKSPVIKKITKAVQNLEENLTRDQIFSFQIKLKILLLNIYIMKLEERAKSQCDAEMKIALKAAKNSLEKKKMTPVVLKQLWHSVETLEKKFLELAPSSLRQVHLTLTKKFVDRDVKILDSKDDEMLCDFVSSDQ